jgi:Spy/CpxP family protein refolding chaperone
MRHLLLVAMLVFGLALSLAAAPVCAQQAKDKDKFLDRLETLTIWKMMEALDLDKTTGNKVMEIRNKFLSERKQLKNGLNQDLGRLRELLQKPPNTADDPELARIVQDVREKRKRLMELFDEQYNEVAKVLSVRQQAQLIVFLKDFGKEIHAILAQPSRAPREPGAEDHFRKPLGPPPPGAGPPPGQPRKGGKASTNNFPDRSEEEF